MVLRFPVVAGGEEREEREVDFGRRGRVHDLDKAVAIVEETYENGIGVGGGTVATADVEDHIEGHSKRINESIYQNTTTTATSSHLPFEIQIRIDLLCTTLPIPNQPPNQIRRLQF